MPIYDVENRFSYYKSYSDNIMSGSALPTLGSSTWDRGVIGSVVSGSEEYKGATLLSDYTFKKANPFFRSGETRYLRLSSNSQTIKDSITPNIVDLYFYGETGSGSLVYGSNTNQGFSAALFLYFSRDGYAITSSVGDNPRVNNIEFANSFPYEKKYYNLKAFPSPFVTINKYIVISNFGISKTFFQASFSEGLTIPDIESKAIISLTNSGSSFNDQSVVIENFVEYTGSYNGSNFSIGPIDNYDGFTFQNKILSQKIVFGIRPRGLSTNLSSSTTPALQNYLETYSTGSIIEGWKYGLYNGVPTNFSAVFRQNHYGQFRDMLEQRIYTATYNNPQIGGPMDANGGIKFISGSALAGERDDYAIAKIYNSQSLNVAEAYRVNPYGSGIFDTLYRASQPWHADDTRITVRGGI